MRGVSFFLMPHESEMFFWCFLSHFSCFLCALKGSKRSEGVNHIMYYNVNLG